MMNQSIPSVIVIISALLSIWLAFISVYFFRLHQQLQLITKGVSKKDLKTILTQLANDQENVSQELKDLRSSLTGLTADGHKHFQKIGFIRFNPFADTGGNQSFSLCLLDARNDGIVITSLHSRDSTRIYTKQILHGVADGRELSKEEQQAYKAAQKTK